MTATIRTITRRSSGRESTRTVEVPRNILFIGRATECDVQLADLRIALRHARLTISDGGFLLEAEGDNEFKVGNRIVRKLEARLGQPVVAQFGPYALRFGEAAGRLVIDVERVQQAVRIHGDPDKVFSLRRTWLSKRIGSWTLAIAVLAAFLVFPAVTFGLKDAAVPEPARIQAGQMWLSGTLSGPHAMLAENCTACHEQAFVSVRDETCLSCHEDIRQHADHARMTLARGTMNDVQKGLRAVAAAFDKPAGRCAECHMEHNGVEGVAPATEASCTACHAGMTTRLPDAHVADASDFGRDHPEFHPTLAASGGEKGRLTRAWDIATLDRARKTREAAAPPTQAAASCDGFAIGQPNFRGLPRPDGAGLPAEATPGDDSGLIFPHDVHLAADGCVSAVAQRLPGDRYGDKLVCKDCHTLNEDGVGFAPVRMEENCADCHSLVFDTAGGMQRELRHGRTGEVIATLLDFYQARIVGATLGGASGEDRRRPGEAGLRTLSFREAAFAQASSRAATRVRAVFSEGGACYGCHVVTPPSRAGGLDFAIAPVNLRDSFLPRGVFDHRAHETGDLECADCHKAETSRTSSDVLLPSVATCQTCHGGEHALAKTQSSCVMCHGFHSTEPDAARMTPTGVRKSAAAGGTILR
jgi:hypothetical protein